MDKDWIDVLRDKLLDYEEPAPDGLWDRIEASLQARERARGRRRVLIWSLAAAAAVALGVFAGVNLIDRKPDINNDDNRIAVDSQDHRTDQPNDTSSSADFKEGPVTPADHAGLLAKAEIPVTVGNPVVVAIPAEEARIDDVKPVEAKPVEAKPVEAKPVEASPVEAKADEPEVSAERPDDFKTTHDGEDWSDYSSATDDGKFYRNLVAGLSMASTSRNSQNVNTVQSSMFFMGAAPSSGAADNGTAVLPSKANNRISAMDYQTRTRADSEPVTKDENHKRPIRAALNLSYPLSERLWVESGAAYSILNSKFTTSSGETVTEDNQSLGYLGIPLNLRYNFFDSDRITFYASGGGMVEKCLTGSVKTMTTVSGTPRGAGSTRKLDIKPLQWSVNAAAGLQANVLDSFGIFAEPGVSYHFENNANVRSIYTEHPLDFVMTFGARFSFR